MRPVECISVRTLVVEVRVKSVWQDIRFAFRLFFQGAPSM